MARRGVVLNIGTQCFSDSYYPYSQTIWDCYVANNGGQDSCHCATFGDDRTVYGFGGSCDLSQGQPVDVVGNLLTHWITRNGQNSDC